VLDAMTAEARRADPDETGGMLLGWENPSRNEVVVACLVGPGENAQYSRSSFRPDGEWQQAQLAERYIESKGVLTYLGDWHVHPSGGFGMSRRDRRTMARTARHAEARCPRPLMALLARRGDGYRAGVWTWEPTSLRPVTGRAIQLVLRSWDPSEEERQYLSGGH
jgi:integrative and conjugative element protein (TIGR02256 family)